MSQGAPIVRSTEPVDKEAFKARLDEVYTRFARLYDLTVRYGPLWRRWLERTLPHLEGPRLLEVSPGTGFLMTRSSRQRGLEVHGLDLNARLLRTAEANLARAGRGAALYRGDVEAMPFGDGAFDCLVNTMAFSGYPDAELALDEMTRVLRPGGKLVILDVVEPPEASLASRALLGLAAAVGDMIRELGPLLAARGIEFVEHEVGGFGVVRLFIGRTPGGLR